MDNKFVELEIVSPRKVLFTGMVERVVLPGAKAPFTALYNHAPIVSVLSTGSIKWSTGNDERSMAVKSGFVEVRDNKVSALVEM